MNISTHSHGTVLNHGTNHRTPHSSTARSTAQGPSTPVAARMNAAGNDFHIETQKPDKDAIFADYDLTDISPREIDQLTDRLREHGVYDFKEMMMLEIHGERFTLQLQRLLKEAGILDEIRLAPTTGFDYLSAAADQIEMARRSGDPYELAQHNYDALMEIHARSVEIRSERRADLPPVNTVSAHPMISQSAFALQSGPA